LPFPAKIERLPKTGRLCGMETKTPTRTHPHAEATYRIVPQKDMTYGVEVSIPGTHPTMVTGLATEQDAAAWVERHKQRVQTPLNGRLPFRKSTSGPPRVK
jgi:hypothetical protein